MHTLAYRFHVSELFDNANDDFICFVQNLWCIENEKGGKKEECVECLETVLCLAGDVDFIKERKKDEARFMKASWVPLVLVRASGLLRRDGQQEP